LVIGFFLKKINLVTIIILLASSSSRRKDVFLRHLRAVWFLYSNANIKAS
jgi:hypothetical protein